MECDGIDFECPICRDQVYAGVSDSAGDVYCAACLDSWLKTRPENISPFGVRLYGLPISSRAIQRAMNARASEYVSNSRRLVSAIIRKDSAEFLELFGELDSVNLKLGPRGLAYISSILRDEEKMESLSLGADDTLLTFMVKYLDDGHEMLELVFMNGAPIRWHDGYFHGQLLEFLVQDKKFETLLLYLKHAHYEIIESEIIPNLVHIFAQVTNKGVLGGIVDLLRGAARQKALFISACFENNVEEAARILAADNLAKEPDFFNLLYVVERLSEEILALFYMQEVKKEHTPRMIMMTQHVIFDSFLYQSCTEEKLRRAKAFFEFLGKRTNFSGIISIVSISLAVNGGGASRDIFQLWFDAFNIKNEPEIDRIIILAMNFNNFTMTNFLLENCTTTQKNYKLMIFFASKLKSVSTLRTIMGTDFSVKKARKYIKRYKNYEMAVSNFVRKGSSYCSYTIYKHKSEM
jgi:hypothetical protein